MALLRALLLLIVSASACLAQSRDKDDVATLYRDSVTEAGTRYHVATFDADLQLPDGATFDYNLENCRVAAKLFETQEGAKAQFWCERGFYRE